MNGALAGLVAITASANIMTPIDAVAIGSIAGAFCIPRILCECKEVARGKPQCMGKYMRI